MRAAARRDRSKWATKSLRVRASLLLEATVGARHKDFDHAIARRRRSRWCGELPAEARLCRRPSNTVSRVLMSRTLSEPLIKRKRPVPSIVHAPGAPAPTGAPTRVGALDVRAATRCRTHAQRACTGRAERDEHEGRHSDAYNSIFMFHLYHHVPFARRTGRGSASTQTCASGGSFTVLPVRSFVIKFV